MIWRSGSQLLVDEAGRFSIISESGEVRLLEPREWSIDDELGRDRYFVRGAQLVRGIERYLPREEHSEEIVLDGLIDVSHDPEIQRAVEATMVDATVIAVERARKQKSRRDELERTLPTEYPQSKLAWVAKQMLHQRAQQYEDAMAVALLKTLGHLIAAPAQVTETYALGCMMACFSATSREPPPPIQVELAPELIEELAQRAAELEREARVQDDIDAHNNAVAYFRAAATVRAAIGRS